MVSERTQRVDVAMAYGSQVPAAVASPYQAALGLYKTKRYARAANLLEGLIESTSLQGHLARFYHALACRYEAENQMEQGNVGQAAEYLRRGISSNPCSETMIAYLADCYVHMEKYRRAGETFGRLMELNDADGDVRLKEALSCFLAGGSDMAITKLEELVRQSPNHFEVNYKLGLILAADGHSDRAVPFLTTACRLRPENVDVHWRLGLAHGMRGHMVEAVRHLQQAHRLEPGNNSLLHHMILAVKQARHQGIELDISIVREDSIVSPETEASLDRLADLIVAEPEFITAFLDLPETEIDDQIFSSLLQIVLRALERHPEYADLHYHCSCVYQRLGKSQEAIEETEYALSINPRYVNALIHLATLYARTNRDEEAIHRLKAAVAGGANFADVHYLLGNLYRRRGAVDHARLHYRRALRINHKFQAARDALAAMAAA